MLQHNPLMYQSAGVQLGFNNMSGVFPAAAAAEYQRRAMALGAGLPPQLWGPSNAANNLPLLQYLAASQSQQLPTGYGGLFPPMAGVPHHAAAGLQSALKQHPPDLQAPIMPSSQQASQQLMAMQQNDVSASGAKHGVTGRSPLLLHVPSDEDSISPYQCLARKQIELFEAQVNDVEAGAQGRNR
jgi:hypothetical protein